MNKLLNIRNLIVVIEIIILMSIWWSYAVVDAAEPEDWSKIQNSREIVDYLDFLFLYPDSVNAPIARQRIDAIQNHNIDIVEANIDPTECLLCGGWEIPGHSSSFSLNPDGTAVLQQVFATKDVTCLLRYRNWAIEDDVLVFRHGEASCQNRKKHILEDLKIFFRMENQDTLTLRGEQDVVYKRNPDLVIDDLKITGIPQLCIYDQCLLERGSTCEQRQVLFECVEYTYENTTCTDQLGSDWKPLKTVRPLHFDSMDDCQQARAGMSERYASQ
ncbi:MAG: hypothetical protein HQM12_04955 [SAR324 cluster bacterium]|nr:hypothetical protein [SAR324 cluster bacterium]